MKTRVRNMKCGSLDMMAMGKSSKCSLFSSPDPKGHVSHCHHLASVVVVRRKLFQKSSLLKVLDQNGNQTWSESSLGCLVPKLCPVMPCTNQHGRCC